MNIIRLLLLIFLAAVMPPVYAQDTEESEIAPSWCVSVWYPSSEHPRGSNSITENLNVIDVVNPFWYSPLPDGSLRVHSGAEDEASLTLWREANLTVLPSIFSSISTMIEETEIRANHIAAIVEVVERMDYDGIDIDYEGFGLHTREPFSLFIEELAAELHARNRLLSMAVHAKTSDAGTSDAAAAQDWPRLTAAVDVFRIMTYDYHSRVAPPGPIGPPQWSLDVVAYAASVTDLEKVRLGLHFYGYSWSRGTPPAITLQWESIQRWVDSFNLEITRDPNDMEARIDLAVRGLPRQTIYVADSTGLDYKLNLVLETFPHLGGVSIWGLGGEDPQNWDVLQSTRPAECSSEVRLG